MSAKAIKRKCYQDAVKHLKARGYIVWRSTWWNAFAHCSQDLGGVFDCIAFREEIVGVQATDHTSRSKHRKKLEACKDLDNWRAAGGRVLLLTFGNVGGVRGRKKTVHEEWME